MKEKITRNYIGTFKIKERKKERNKETDVSQACLIKLC